PRRWKATDDAPSRCTRTSPTLTRDRPWCNALLRRLATSTSRCITLAAQFIAMCRSAKTCEIGENLLAVADPISRLQERLSHVSSCIRPPILQPRPLSGLHSYAAMERSATPVSPVPEPGRRSLGAVPLPPRLQTLLVSRLPAHLQRPHRDPLAPEQEAAVVLDTRHFPVVPVVLVATDCSGVGGPYPDELSLVLAFTQDPCRFER